MMKLFHFLALSLTFFLQNTTAAEQTCKNLKKVDPNCQDLDRTGKTTGSGRPWYDSSGPVYKNGPLPDCAWYGQYWARCQKDGHNYKNFGLTACQACCACGGGEIKEVKNDLVDSWDEPDDSFDEPEIIEDPIAPVDNFEFHPDQESRMAIGKDIDY